MRAASSAWMVGGISSAASSTPAVQRSPSRLSAPSWTSMRTSSPTKSGLPSLVASTRPAIAAGQLRRRRSRSPRAASPRRRRGRRASRRRSTRPPGVGERRARASRSSGRAADEDEERHVGAPLHEVLGQVEQQRLRPLEVVDREHDRPRGGERGEQAPDDEEGLLRRRRRAARGARRCPSAIRRALGVVAGQRGLDRGAHVRRRRRRRRGRGTRGAPRRSARTWRRRPRRSARSARSRRRRAGARTRRADATCRGRASRGRTARRARRRRRPPRRRPP